MKSEKGQGRGNFPDSLIRLPFHWIAALNVDYNNIAVQVLYSLKSGRKANLTSPSNLAVVSNRHGPTDLIGDHFQNRNESVFMRPVIYHDRKRDYLPDPPLSTQGNDTRMMQLVQELFKETICNDTTNNSIQSLMGIESSL